jgi:hypothetical protein
MPRLTWRGLSAAAGLVIGLAVACGATQATAQPKAAPAPPARGPAAAPVPEPAAEPAQQAGPEWGNFPTMLLEKVYRGPLRDTIIQRWRDPIDGTVCFLYIPISTPLLPPPAQGYVQYGPNQIGSVSCVHPTQVLQLWQGATPPPVPAPATRR